MTSFPARLGSLLRLSAVALTLTWAGAVQADSYPSRPVQIVVPFAAGGPLDLAARVIARELQGSLKQPFVVLNQTGASGNIGAATVARAAPDGYTLLMVPDTTVAANPTLYGSRLGYSVERDLRPVATLMACGLMLVVSPSVPAQNLKEFLALGRDKGITFASAGFAAPGHLLMEQLIYATGINATHIPYRGTAQAVNDLFSGQVQSGFLVTPGVVQHASSGMLRPLAVSSAARSSLAPSVPTVAEAGMPTLTAEYFYVAMAPHGTPDAIVGMLNEHIRMATRSEAFKEFERNSDVHAVPDTAAETAKRLVEQTANLSALIKARNIRLD